ncbi:MAG: rhomboid family intramembrane serine protease [Alphaproteobacteria bacterium]|nr:rhomboid family intramembrane serine protease [Alphaproteobacteria bacterium]
MIPLSDENPTLVRPVVTITLIVLCVLVYMWELSLGDPQMDRVLTVLGFTPNAFSHAEEAQVAYRALPIWTTLLTSIFLHASTMHVAGNMLYLWIFGNNVEDAMGHVKFIVFYLVSGFAALFTMLLVDPNSHTPVVGASGAISGVLAAYMLLYPRARVTVLVPILLLHIRAVWVVGIWFVLQLVSAATTPASEPGTAWWAHVGGFAAGLLMTPLLKSRSIPYFGPIDPRGPWANG